MKKICILLYFSVVILSVTHLIAAQTTDDGCSGKTSCDDCIGVTNLKCLWCNDATIKNGGKCSVYPAGKVLPTSVCALNDARWGNCSINFQILVIVLSVLIFVILLVTATCIYCCCRRCTNRRAARIEIREDANATAERVEREARNSQKRAERQVKYDEIRRKYGLSRDGGGSSHYSRFENETA